MGKRGPAKGHGGRPPNKDRTAVRLPDAGGRVLSTKLSAVEGELFDRVLAAVAGEDRAAGGTGAKLSPSAMVRRLILEAAKARGV